MLWAERREGELGTGRQGLPTCLQPASFLASPGDTQALVIQLKTAKRQAARANSLGLPRSINCEEESLQPRTKTPGGMLPAADKCSYSFEGKSEQDSCR